MTMIWDSWSTSAPPLVVGLCGRARHGKDSVALTMKGEMEVAGLRVFHSSISELVLEEAQLRGLVPATKRRADLDGTELAALVKLGHEGRAQGEDFWLELMITRILDYDFAGGGARCRYDAVLVPGIRFPNEIGWLKAADGWLVRVARRNEDGSEYISPDRDPNDPMETVLNKAVPDLEITAKTGQEEWLEAQAVGLVKFLIKNGGRK